MRITKSYCDRCGKETDSLKEIHVKIPVLIGNRNIIYGDYCKDCIKKFEEYIRGWK